MKSELDNKGFTLIELIVALALFGIVTLFAFSLLGFNYSVFSRSISRYHLQSSLNHSMKFIEEKLKFENYIKSDNNNESIIYFGNSYENSIYLEDGSIKLKEDLDERTLSNTDIIIKKLKFTSKDNLLNFKIEGKSVNNKESFNIETTIELLNVIN